MSGRLSKENALSIQLIKTYFKFKNASSKEQSAELVEVWDSPVNVAPLQAIGNSAKDGFRGTAELRELN